MSDTSVEFEIRESRPYCCNKCGAKLVESLKREFFPIGAAVGISGRRVGDKVRIRCLVCQHAQLWETMG